MCKLQNILQTYLLTYLLTHSIQQSPSWEANQFSASQKIAHFYGSQRFITTFTSACHLSLSWTRSVQSMNPTSHFLMIHINIILPSMLRSSKWSPSSGFPTKTLDTPLLSPIHAMFPASFILLNLITWIIWGEEYRSLSSSLCSFLHSPVTSSILSPNILLSTILSNTLSLHSSLDVSHQVSHSYKTTGKIIVLYILIFIFLGILQTPLNNGSWNSLVRWSGNLDLISGRGIHIFLLYVVHTSSRANPTTYICTTDTGSWCLLDRASLW